MFHEDCIFKVKIEIKNLDTMITTGYELSKEASMLINVVVPGMKRISIIESTFMTQTIKKNSSGFCS